MPGQEGTRQAIPPLVREKLEAFDQLEPIFRSSFFYVQQIHGEARFPAMPIAAIVRYLHALFVCHRKDALLSVPTTISRYDHRRALDLLLGWQAGQTVPVVEFLEAKLDMQPFLPLARQLEAAEASGNGETVRRLRHGTQILLNRAHNLYAALDTIFGLQQAGLLDEVRGACVELGLTPNALHAEAERLATPLYSYLPHAELARRNMLVMNSLGVEVTSQLADRPGDRTERVLPATPPLPAYAENPIPHAVEFTPPSYSTAPFIPTDAPPIVADVGLEEQIGGDE